MSKVEFRNVNKSFGDNQVLTNFELSVDDGEFLVLLGPSGCGKTTALRILAGLEDVSSGSVHIGDREVTSEEPKDRDIAMVFQSYALYPHMTVRKNVEFPLRNAGVSKDEIASRVNQALQTVGLSDLGDRKPGQLSGGQRQRVALARAIVRRPKVFLMDEPLSNLDATLRQQTRADIAALQRTLGTTTLYVTHDQVEAMTMGTRIAVMYQGKLQQVGAPTDLYHRPANAFVASFLGNPGMNLIRGSVQGGTVCVAGSVVTTTNLADRSDVTIGVRAEDLRIGDAGFACEVVIVEDLGSEVHVVCQSAESDRIVIRQLSAATRPTLGQTVHVTIDGATHLFDAVTGERCEG